MVVCSLAKLINWMAHNRTTFKLIWDACALLMSYAKNNDIKFKA